MTPEATGWRRWLRSRLHRRSPPENECNGDPDQGDCRSNLKERGKPDDENGDRGEHHKHRDDVSRIGKGVARAALSAGNNRCSVLCFLFHVKPLRESVRIEMEGSGSNPTGEVVEPRRTPCLPKSRRQVEPSGVRLVRRNAHPCARLKPLQAGDSRPVACWRARSAPPADDVRCMP
jgi:hypothetical protein